MQVLIIRIKELFYKGLTVYKKEKAKGMTQHFLQVRTFNLLHSFLNITPSINETRFSDDFSFNNSSGVTGSKKAV